MCKRNIHWFPLVCILTRDRTCNPGVCPDRESNLQPLGLMGNTQHTEPHQSGVCVSITLCQWVICFLLGPWLIRFPVRGGRLLCLRCVNAQRHGTGSRQVELPFALKENCECEYFCEATICEMLWKDFWVNKIVFGKIVFYFEQWSLDGYIVLPLGWYRSVKVNSKEREWNERTVL